MMGFQSDFSISAYSLNERRNESSGSIEMLLEFMCEESS